MSEDTEAKTREKGDYLDTGGITAVNREAILNPLVRSDTENTRYLQRLPGATTHYFEK